MTSVVYDAYGRRAARKSGADQTTYVGELYEKRVDASVERHVFSVVADGGLVAQLHYDSKTSTDRRLYYLTDLLGSPAMVLDDTGNVVEQHDYEPFGQRIDGEGQPQTGGDPTVTFGFTGHEHDKELGLVNMRARIYDPQQRRFLTPDPIVSDALHGQSYNPYSYVLNNPVNYSDPSGYQSEIHTNDRGERYTIDEHGTYNWLVPPIQVTVCGNPRGCKDEAPSEPSGDYEAPDVRPGGIRADGDVGASHSSSRVSVGSGSGSWSVFDYRPELGDIFPYQARIRSDATTIDFVEHFAKDVYNTVALLGNTVGRAGWSVDRGITGAVKALGGSPGDAEALKLHLAAPRMIGLAAYATSIASSQQVHSTRSVLGQMVAPTLRSIWSGSRKWYAVRNSAGGRIWVTRRPTDYLEVRALVEELRKTGAEVKLLTGTHGELDGSMAGEYKFFLEDLGSFAKDAGVQIHEVWSPNGYPYNIAGIVNGPGEVVAAFCYSERSAPLLKVFTSP